MAPNAIVAKLNTALSEPVDTEAKVVYVLCEVRKLLERTPAAQRPFALNMYCHWALHVDLHGKDTIAPFLQQVDAYVHSVIVGPEDLVASHRMIREFVMMETFRSQLGQFLRDNSIRTDLVDQDSLWNGFLSHYGGVIEDGSLAFKSTQGLQHVQQVTFQKGRRGLGEFVEIPFDIVWSITLLDGRTLDIQVNARPPRGDVGRMISSGLHLR